MSLWHCTTCTARYAVGLPACPQCGGLDFLENGVPLPARICVCQTPGCGAAYAVQIFTCPRCLGTDLTMEDRMAKITVGGASNAAEPTGEPGHVPPAETDTTPETETAEASPPAPETPVDPTVRPPAAAPKAAWVDHVVAVSDLDREQAEGMKKDELRAWTAGGQEPAESPAEEPVPDGTLAEMTITADAEVTRPEGAP